MRNLNPAVGKTATATAWATGKEAADVDGNGMVDFREERPCTTPGPLCCQAGHLLGQGRGLRHNGDGIVDFGVDVVREG